MTKISEKLRKKLEQKGGGFTLLEVVIAIFVIIVGILGVMSLIYNAIVAVSITSNRLIAAYLAQEGIEIVRNIRDTNWLEGENWDNGLASGDYQADYNDQNLSAYNDDIFLNLETSNNFYGYEDGSPTIFKRKINIQKPATDVLEITVEVNWQERGKTYSFPPVRENLYKWY